MKHVGAGIACCACLCLAGRAALSERAAEAEAKAATERQTLAGMQATAARASKDSSWVLAGADESARMHCCSLPSMHCCSRGQPHMGAWPAACLLPWLVPVLARSQLIPHARCRCAQGYTPCQSLGPFFTPPPPCPHAALHPCTSPPAVLNKHLELLRANGREAAAQLEADRKRYREHLCTLRSQLATFQAHLEGASAAAVAAVHAAM